MRLHRCAACLIVTCLLAAASHGGAKQSAAFALTPAALNLDASFASIAPTGPGCVAGMALAGAPPVTRAYGQADLEHGVALTAESVFETGSLAKQFTAAAMMLLVQDGKMTLDDDIRRYLPELPDYGATITIRHLLTHTSGLREQWSLLALAGRSPGTQVHAQATILDLASRQKGLNFRPGAEFLYTNTNYALAALIIERVSGQSLQRLTDQRLFKPLGMIHTQWREDFRKIVPGRAIAYAQTDDGFITNMPFTNVYGNGGMLTTISDLLRWNAFLDHPAQIPGGEALVATLQTPGRLNSGAALGYGLGLEIARVHGLREIAHSGSTGGYKAWLGRYPDQGLSVAVLCNSDAVDPIALGEKVSEQALRVSGYAVAEIAASTPPKAKATGAALTQDQGLFRDPLSGELIETKIVEGKMMLRQGSSQTAIVGAGAQFVRDHGRTVGILLEHDGVRQHFVAVGPAVLGGNGLADYVGTYYSAELDTRIVVARQGDVLVMRQPFAVEWRLAPRFSDGFTTRLRGTTTFVFTRGPEGKVDGLSAWATGVRNLRFVRQRP